MSTIYAIMDAVLPFEWLSYTFMKNAFLAILLITPLFGLLGTMAVDNKMAFFSDALGHSALTGIAIGVVLGWSNQMAAMLIFGILWALLITFVKHNSKMSADTIISVFSSTSIWLMLFNPLMITSVNSPLARSRGIRARMTEYGFTILVAVAVMMSIRWVGVMLINSLLILPAAASRNVARNAAGYMRLSVVIALVCGVTGLALSYYLNTSAGAAVVLCCAVVYFATLPLRRK